MVYGKSVVASLAYRGCCRLVDEETGIAHDYRRKAHLVGSVVAHPPGCEWTNNRQRFANVIERAEKRCDARIGREIVLISPHGMDEAVFQNQLVAYSRFLSKRYTTAVYADIHDPKAGASDQTAERNLHAHIFLPTRSVTPEGTGTKIRCLDLKTWANQEVEELRQEWAQMLSRGLRNQGEEGIFDHRSFSRRGIEREAQAKEGRGRAMWERGLFSERVQLNEEIAAKNELQESLEREAKELEESIAEFEEILKTPIAPSCFRRSTTFVDGERVSQFDLGIYSTLGWLEELLPDEVDVLKDVGLLVDICFRSGDYDAHLESVPEDLTIEDLLAMVVVETERRKLQEFQLQEKLRERQKARRKSPVPLGRGYRR